MDRRATEQSTSGSLGDVSQVQNAAPQLYSHMFTQCPVTSLLTMSFTRPSPTLVLLQVKNPGAKRSGTRRLATREVLSTHSNV